MSTNQTDNPYAAPQAQPSLVPADDRRDAETALRSTGSSLTFIKIVGGLHFLYAALLALGFLGLVNLDNGFSGPLAGWLLVILALVALNSVAGFGLMSVKRWAILAEAVLLAFYFLVRIIKALYDSAHGGIDIEAGWLIAYVAVVAPFVAIVQLPGCRAVLSGVRRGISTAGPKRPPYSTSDLS